MSLSVRIALILGWVAAGLPGPDWVSATGYAHAEGAETQTTTLEEYCRTWAANGMFGVKVHLRDGSRKITYIDENELRYLLKHQAAGDNLYLLKGEYSPAHRRYLEESLLAGYDRSVNWLRLHAGQTPDISNWEAEAYLVCLNEVPGAIRVLLDAR